jgi:hypothetical protein
MQWTLRTMLLVTAGVGYCIAGVTTFGIVATTTSIAILGAAWFVNSRMTNGRRGWPKRLALAGVTVVILYVGTFLVFRLFRTFEFSLAHPDDPQHNIVVFSLNPTVQEIARQAYYPLIKWIPGHCAYPTGEQMKLLNHDPFTDEPFTLYW